MSSKITHISVAESIAVFSYTGPMSREDMGIEMCHPDHGWLPVTMVNETEFALSKQGEFHAWFSLSSEAVSAWPVKGAADLMRWIQRARLQSMYPLV